MKSEPPLFEFSVPRLPYTTLFLSALQTRVRPSPVGGSVAVPAVGGGILHPARAQHMVAHILFPALPRDLLDELAADRIEEIVISIGRAKTGLGLKVRD